MYGKLVLSILLISTNVKAQSEFSAHFDVWGQQSYIASRNSVEIFTHDSWLSLQRSKVYGFRTSLGLEFQKKYFTGVVAVDHESFDLDYEYYYGGMYIIGGMSFGFGQTRVTARESVKLWGVRVMPGVVINPAAKRNRTKVYFGPNFLNQYYRNVEGGKVVSEGGYDPPTDEPATIHNLGKSYAVTRERIISGEFMAQSSWTFWNRLNLGVNAGFRIHGAKRNEGKKDWIIGLSLGYHVL